MFFLKTTANSPYPYISNKTWQVLFFISNTEYKIRKLLFIHKKSFSSLVHLTSIMPGIKEVKHSTKTGSTDNKPDNLHDESIYTVRTPNKIYDSLKERMEILALNQVIM